MQTAALHLPKAKFKADIPLGISATTTMISTVLKEPWNVFTGVRNV
jgi:hypothetical protein